MKNIILFDMDGVLLEHGGYHEALKASVQRIGMALGAPRAAISDQQIARFESLNVTNEWDSLAICTALILLQVWKVDPSIRLNNNIRPAKMIIRLTPEIDHFFDSYNKSTDLPGLSAYKTLISANPGLNHEQESHLANILIHCRDIYQSPTLPLHQEAVLGSEIFKSNYKLEPQLNVLSYLAMYDRPAISKSQHKSLITWLKSDSNFAGIMTNRPSQSYAGYLSSPEAEIGAKLIKLDGLPMLGSGMLAWFATHGCQIPGHTFLKPNPVHALALMQMCLGHSIEDSLNKAYALWQGEKAAADWQDFADARLVVFEDSAKGLLSGKAAYNLLSELGIITKWTLFGVSRNNFKVSALAEVADRVISDINEVEWGTL